MTIETTMAALLEAEAALKRLGGVKLPVKTAYHLMKLTSLSSVETKYFHGERDKAIRELGEETTPGQFQVTAANMPAYIDRLNDLARLPVTIAWGPLPLTALEGIDIAAGDLLALAPFLQFEDAPAAAVKADGPRRMEAAK